MKSSHVHPLNKPEVISNAFRGSFDEEGNLLDTKIQDLIVGQLRTKEHW